MNIFEKYFSICLIFSFFIHASIIGFIFFVKDFELPRKQKVEKLVVEFVGEISDKQTKQQEYTQKQVEQEAVTPQKQVVNEPEEKIETPKEVKEEKPKESKDAIKKEIPKEKPKPKPVVKQQSTQTAAQEKINENIEKNLSTQTTIEHDKIDINEFKKYLASLKKNIQSHVKYPKEARDFSLKGNPKVRFYIDKNGIVDRSSIVITKSSGHDLLDEKAIEAILSGSPYDKPPKDLSIEIEISFNAKINKEK